MGTRVPKFLLMFGPTVVVVGIDTMSWDVTRGIILILLAVFITIVGSYYQWVEPKNKSKLWLLFPGCLTVLGYIPLMLLKEQAQLFDRLYISSEFYKSLGVSDNFTLDAANITKCYLELMRHYSGVFSDKASLLATAGLLNALSYDLPVSPERVFSIAKKSVLVKEKPMTDFIINLEIELYQIDAPDLDISEIREACFRKRKDIIDVIHKVKRSYVKETDIASAASRFMHSAQFETLRPALGIGIEAPATAVGAASRQS